MTAAFLSKLIVEDDGGFPFTLVSSLTYASALLDRSVLVPSGFRTDFASIPRPLWNILPPVGKYDRAAVIHDYLYQLAPFGISRSYADQVLREAMSVCGVGAFTRFLIYSGVRVGGGGIWKRYRSAPAKV